MTLFYGGGGLGFHFTYIGSKVLPLNTEVSSRAAGISQSLQFINFQRRAAALRWSKIWVCLVRQREGWGGVGAWNKGSPLTDSYTRTKGSGTKDAAEMLLPLINHPGVTIHSSMDDKTQLLNGSVRNKGPHPMVLTVNCVCSVIITALQSRTVSKGHALLAL